MNDLHHCLTLFSADSAVVTDDGVVAGVSIITKGSVLGYPALIDDVTLQQVFDCLKAFKGGIKVKVDHSFAIANVIGYIDNFILASEKVRGDLHLFKEHSQYASIREILNTLSSQVGFSLAFSGSEEVINNAACVRCTEIYSVDLVDRPATNPDGLFSVDSHNDNMNVVDEVVSGLTRWFSQQTAEQAKVELAQRTKELEELRAQLAERDKRLSVQEAANQKLLSDHAAEIERLEGSLEERASAKSAAVLKTLGITVPVKDAGGGITNAGNVYDEYRRLQLSDPRAATKFWADHKEEIYKLKR